MARPLALAAAIAVSLLLVTGAGGSPAQTPKRGGTVVVASVREPVCLNWVLAACSGGAIRPSPVDGVFEGALEAGPAGYRSVLASRADITSAEDGGFTVTYRIRPRARWSDGAPVTATDFVFAYRTILKHFGRFGVDPYGVIGGIRSLGARTVRVEYKLRFADWRSERTSGLPRPLPRHLLRGVDLTTIWRDRLDDPRTGAPVSNGPFMIQDWARGRQLVLRRNSRYWGPRPAYLDRIVYRFVSDPGAALRAGEVHVIGARNALEQGAALELARKPVDGIDVVSTPGAGRHSFVIRVAKGGHEALRDKRVRRALAYGLDREALVRALYGDVVRGLRPLQNTLFLAQEDSYEPNWETYSHRPERARALLRQAGCGRGSDGIFVCGRQRLQFRFVTTGGVPHREQAILIAQRQLRGVGIEVVPQYATVSALLGSGGILARGDFDVALFETSRAAPDQVLVDLGCGWPGNFGGYCSRLVTTDLLDMTRTIDVARHAAVANRVDRRLVLDVPVIPLFQTPAFVAYRDTVRGIVPSAFNDPTWNAEEWWLDR